MFNHDDISSLIGVFSSIRAQLDDLGAAQFVGEYKHYVDQTLELLKSALAALKRAR
ncbi:MAG TPA: hypothetical protein VGD58_11855 [Herpetosiphonaceae bacterium]